MKRSAFRNGKMTANSNDNILLKSFRQSAEDRMKHLVRRHILCIEIRKNFAGTPKNLSGDIRKRICTYLNMIYPFHSEKKPFRMKKNIQQYRLLNI